MLLYFVSGLALAQDLKVVTEHLPPYNFIEGGKLTGYSTELLQLILKELQLNPEIQVLPWSRAFQMATERNNVLIYTIARSKERDPNFEWIGPIASRKIVLLKLEQRKDIQINSLWDFQSNPGARSYKIGIVRELASSQKILSDELIPHNQLDAAPTTESNLKKLLLGRVDMIVGDEAGTQYELKNGLKDKTKLSTVAVVDAQIAFYFAIKKGSDPILVLRLKQAFEKIKATNAQTELKQKYELN